MEWEGKWSEDGFEGGWSGNGAVAWTSGSLVGFLLVTRGWGCLSCGLFDC